MGGENVFGSWPVMDELLRTAENGEEGYADRPRDQAELIYQLGNPTGGYWQLPPAHQQEVITRLIPLVPRVGEAREPKVTAERLFRLWHGPNPFESISRALRVEERFIRRTWTPEEELYRTGGYHDNFTGWGAESDTPIPFLWWAATATLAAVCGWRFWVDRNADELRLGTLYLIFVGAKGTLKSVSLSAAREVLHHVNHQVYPWVAGTDLPKYDKPNPFTVRFMPEDTNWRTIVGCLKSETHMMTPWLQPHEIDRDVRGIIGKDNLYRASEHGVLLLTELSVLFGKDNFAVDRIVPGLNAMHDGKSFVYHTQSGGNITLKQPSLTMVGCCPPEIMQSAVTPLLLKGGLMDRTIVVYQDTEQQLRYPTPRPRDPIRAAQLAMELVPFARRLRPLELAGDRAAVRWFEEWFAAQPKLGVQDTTLPRRSNHLWRTSAYIALGCGHQPTIQVSDLEKAARILDHEYASFSRLSEALDTDDSAQLLDHIERVLLRMGAIEPAYVFKRDLFQALRGKRGLTPMMKAMPFLDSLEQAGRIRHFLVKDGRSQGQGYQLTTTAADDLRGRRTPTDPQASQAQRPPEARHRRGTVYLVSAAAGQAQEPEPELEQE